jgi:hypothetical protein
LNGKCALNPSDDSDNEEKVDLFKNILNCFTDGDSLDFWSNSLMAERKMMA